MILILWRGGVITSKLGLTLTNLSFSEGTLYKFVYWIVPVVEGDSQMLTSSFDGLKNGSALVDIGRHRFLGENLD